MNNQQSFSSQLTPLSGVNELLKKAWEVYRARIKVLLGIMLVPIIVSFIIFIISAILGFSSLFYFFTTFDPRVLSGLLPIIVVFALVMLIVGSWSNLALIYAIKEREQRIGVKESFQKTKDKIISSLWVSFLVGLAILAGSLLLIIPGIIIGVWFSFSIFVLVSEGLKGTKALTQSKELVRGRWIKVFWRMFVIFIIIFLFNFIIGLIVEELGISFLGDIISFLIAPFSTIYSFLLYEDLKKSKEALAKI